MVKGAIIRRKCENGPIGPYMRIMHIEEDRIYADVVGSLDNPNVMLFKKDVYVCTQLSLPIDERLLNKLKDGYTIMAQHPSCKKWLSAVNNKPQIIRFYTVSKGLEVVFTMWKALEVKSLGEMVVKIIVDRKLV